ITGHTYSDRMLMNDGWEEYQTWTDTSRVGYGHFRFNTYRALPERRHGTDGLTFGHLNDDDGDGVHGSAGDHPDIVLCGDIQPLQLWFNDGQGNYAQLTDTHLPREYTWRCSDHSIALGDLDGD